MRKNNYFRMEVDERGMPVLSLSEPNWLLTVLSSCSSYIARIFKSKKQIEKEDMAVRYFILFLQHLQLRIGSDSTTGLPVILIEEVKQRKCVWVKNT